MSAIEMLTELARDWRITIDRDNARDTFLLTIERDDRFKVSRFIYEGTNLATLIARAHAGERGDR